MPSAFPVCQVACRWRPRQDSYRGKFCRQPTLARHCHHSCFMISHKRQTALGTTISNNYNLDNQSSIYATNMPKKCPRNAQYLPKTCQTFVQDVQTICPRYVRITPKKCQIYPQDMPKICPKIYPRSILWYIGEPVNNYFSVNVVFFLLRGGIQLKNRYFRSITIFLAFFHTILALVCLRDGLFGPL